MFPDIAVSGWLTGQPWSDDAVNAALYLLSETNAFFAIL